MQTWGAGTLCVSDRSTRGTHNEHTQMIHIIHPTTGYDKPKRNTTRFNTSVMRVAYLVKLSRKTRHSFPAGCTSARTPHGGVPWGCALLFLLCPQRKFRFGNEMLPLSLPLPEMGTTTKSRWGGQSAEGGLLLVWVAGSSPFE